MTRSVDARGTLLRAALCLGALFLAAPLAAGAQAPATLQEQAPATQPAQAPATQPAQAPASKSSTSKPAQPPSTQPAQAPPTQPAPARQAAGAAHPAAMEYRIGAGDTLQLFVWKEPELTHEVTVRIDGNISVPLLGDIQAAGRLPGELAEEITAGLKRFLAAPLVTVAVHGTPSTRFFVLGMVGKSGEFSMFGPTTVVQALAMAGGFREYAKLDDIVILRPEGGATRFVPVNYKRLVASRDWSQNIPLRPGDTVLVP
jgi:polysaccharide biosynthesis/export protein